MITVENLETIHPDLKIVYERMVYGLHGQCMTPPSRASYLRHEAIKTIREVLICRLFKLGNIPNIFYVVFSADEKESLLVYLRKKYKFLCKEVTEEELQAEVDELSRLLDCSITSAIAEA